MQTETTTPGSRTLPDRAAPVAPRRRAARRWRLVKWVLFMAILVGGGVYVWKSGLYQRVQWFAPKTEAGSSELRFYTVKRGQLRINITEGGSLRAVKNFQIVSRLRGMGKIAWLIAQTGKPVKKGTELLRFEQKPFEDSIHLKEVDIANTEQQLVVVQQSIRITESTGQTTIADAQNELKVAKDALRRYQELDGPKAFKDMEALTVTARQAVSDAVKALADLKVKLEDQMFSDDEARKAMEQAVETAKQALKTAKATLSTQTTTQKVFKAYDYPREMDARRQALAKAQLALDKAKLDAQSNTLSAIAEKSKVEYSLANLNKELAQQKEELTRCSEVAPADGIVIYGTGSNREYWRDPFDPKVGVDVYPGQVVLTIPDLSAFEIDLSIGEEYGGKVSKGCKAIVTLDAIPGLVIDGTVGTMSSLAQSRQPWDPNSPKVFAATVQLDNTDRRMVSGMTAKVDIISSVLDNVQFVPLEAVHNEEGKTYCYLPRGEKFEKREVKTGSSNDDNVEIRYGLSAGENVCLFEPPQGQVVASTMPPPPPDTQPASRATSQTVSFTVSQPTSLTTSQPTSGATSRPTSQPASGATSQPASRTASGPTSRPADSGPSSRGAKHAKSGATSKPAKPLRSEGASNSAGKRHG